jgi:ABC-type glycerol-3-phosphate transport system permease component
MTGALIASLPMLAIYIAGQRFFIRGLSAGFGK